MGAFNGFKCDRCMKKFVDGNDNYQPVSLQLIVTFGQTHATTHINSNRATAVWCRECVVSTGIHAPIAGDDKKIAPENELSFEEKFGELIEEMGFLRE